MQGTSSLLIQEAVEVCKLISEIVIPGKKHIIVTLIRKTDSISPIIHLDPLPQAYRIVIPTLVEFLFQEGVIAVSEEDTQYVGSSFDPLYAGTEENLDSEYLTNICINKGYISSKEYVFTRPVVRFNEYKNRYIYVEEGDHKNFTVVVDVKAMEKFLAKYGNKGVYLDTTHKFIEFKGKRCDFSGKQWVAMAHLASNPNSLCLKDSIIRKISGSVKASIGKAETAQFKGLVKELKKKLKIVYGVELIITEQQGQYVGLFSCTNEPANIPENI